MSKAFQCDRCGGFFAPEMMKDDEKFTTIHGYGRQGRVDYKDNLCWERNREDIHLCPGCSKDFKFFMNGGDPDDETDQNMAEDSGDSNGGPADRSVYFPNVIKGGSDERIFYDDTHCPDPPA